MMVGSDVVNPRRDYGGTTSYDGSNSVVETRDVVGGEGVGLVAV